VKFLEKGHTQTEADSMHATIERQIISVAFENKLEKTVPFNYEFYVGLL